MRCGLEKMSWPTGTDPASYRTMNGGTAPGGMNARERFTYPTTSAIAWLISVPGWNISFISDTPWMFFDSTCSIPVM